MSVKKLLEKQSEGFISLHEILTRMANSGDASYADSAKVLHRLLKHKDAPKWWSNDPLEGVHQASEREIQRAAECLKQAALSGQPPRYDEDDLPF